LGEFCSTGIEFGDNEVRDPDGVLIACDAMLEEADIGSLDGVALF
jgi:hypothetical protein